MSHTQQLEFLSKVKSEYPLMFQGKLVLEVGSLDINGSVRPYFDNCEYIGIDIGPGEGVDIVCEGSKYQGTSNHFDTVISCECFEHNPHWIETFVNMHRMCRSGGLVIMSCATTGRPEHGTSRTSPLDSPLTVSEGWEYYKNLTEDDFRTNFKLDELFQSFTFSSSTNPCDLYFTGIVK